jgi:hypothetical protein
MSTSFFKAPQIEFKEDKGLIVLNGSFVSFESDIFWEKILSKCEEMALINKKIRIDLSIDFISSSDIKYLYIMLKTINLYRTQYSVFTVNWIFESFDSDMKDLGESLESCLPNDVSFNFIEIFEKVAA